MLTFKQRYRPRAEREYTKTDLTVYDSAGNTALTGLKVYGKSEIVDGAIKSAGAGWSVVDLGTLNWTYTQTTNYSVFEAPINGMFNPTTPSERLSGLLCSKYPISTQPSYATMDDKSMLRLAGKIIIKDGTFTDATAFKSSMSGVLLCYKLADPTQGNTIAIKTDNGTDVNGTMATFTTGTPLRGVPDTSVRDIMAWNGSAGTVTNKCSELDLGTLNWSYSSNYNVFWANITDLNYIADSNDNILCSKYANSPTQSSAAPDKTIYTRISGENPGVGIKDSDYTDATAFKAAMDGVKLIYELTTPTTEQLTQTENDSIASLQSFDGTTHFTNNATTDMTINYTIKVPTIS